MDFKLTDYRFLTSFDHEGRPQIYCGDEAHHV